MPTLLDMNKFMKSTSDKQNETREEIQLQKKMMEGLNISVS